MCAMGSGKVVEALPLGEFLLQIDVAFVGEQLVELLFVGSVRSLDLSVELWRTWLDVGVANAFVLDMPVEPGLEFVSVVGSDFLDPEREPSDHVVDEVDGIRLGVSIIDLRGADTG